MEGAPLYKQVNGSINGPKSYIFRTKQSNGRWRVAVANKDSHNDNEDGLYNLNQFTTAACLLRSSVASGLPSGAGSKWEFNCVEWRDGIKMEGAGLWSKDPEIICAEGEMVAPASFVFGEQQLFATLPCHLPPLHRRCHRHHYRSHKRRHSRPIPPTL
jgi:hypothetical protein